MTLQAQIDNLSAQMKDTLARKAEEDRKAAEKAKLERESKASVINYLEAWINRYLLSTGEARPDVFKAYFDRIKDQPDYATRYLAIAFRLLANLVYGVRYSDTGLWWNGQSYSHWKDLYQAVCSHLGNTDPLPSNRWLPVLLNSAAANQMPTPAELRIICTGAEEAAYGLAEPDGANLTTADQLALMSLLGLF